MVLAASQAKVGNVVTSADPWHARETPNSKGVTKFVELKMFLEDNACGVACKPVLRELPQPPHSILNIINAIANIDTIVIF